MHFVLFSPKMNSSDEEGVLILLFYDGEEKERGKALGAENISFAENHEESSSVYSVIFLRILMKNFSLVFVLVVVYTRIPEKGLYPSLVVVHVRRI
ncbi:hypothetical protein ElyMa_003170500 [Elysia marginata]|uniref:Uncharacterized protein n=1 Tax=Elysia marginata TaxID=1093978 RepID=A0AAV4IYM4_9GAST|nr:hypothetical protein ElyMa_003170500 [Elysia marginata]